MSPPRRATPAGRAYLDLQARAKNDGRTTQEYLQLYCLEGFLSRLVASGHAQQLVLKGGVLLAAHALRRPTADVDLAALNQSNGTEEVRRLVADIAATPLTGAADDGLTYDSDGASAETIREDDTYSGVRVTMQATLATARLYFNVDVNVGDPIWPAPVDVRLPRLLGGAIELLGYPISMVVAEKTVTAMQRGAVSTRWRDFGDVYQLTGTHAITAGDVRSAIHEVAIHRRVEPEPLGHFSTGTTPSARSGIGLGGDEQRSMTACQRTLGSSLRPCAASLIPSLTATTSATQPFGIPQNAPGTHPEVANQYPHARQRNSQLPPGFDPVLPPCKGGPGAPG